MSYLIGCDAHKHFSQFTVLDLESKVRRRQRVAHTPGAIREFLSSFPAGTVVALESVGNWYWIVDEIEEAKCLPAMAHAAKAKVMMGNVDKTDKLDADGLVTLLQTGTLPTVWLPPRETRDERELHRTRVVFSHLRTALKNRVHGTLSKYALCPPGEQELFSAAGLAWLKGAWQRLPAETQRCLQQELRLLDQVQSQVEEMEKRMRERIALTRNMQLLKSLPGIGDIFAIIIEREMGAVERFPCAAHFASYAGTVPRVKGSGDRVYPGRLRPQANRYLKWVFLEAANGIARQRHHPRWQNKHVVRLYERVRSRKGHAVAVGAVARHLAEAAYWVLKKQEAYREPPAQRDLPRQG